MDTATERAIRLERQLVRVRWLGIAFGVFQVLNYSLGPNDPGQARDAVPGYLLPASFAVFGALALVNAAVSAVLRRTREPGAVTWLARFVFGADVLLLLGIAWIYAFDRFETTWVMFYILTLEGALRYQLRGALIPVMLAFPSELARDLFRNAYYEYPFFFSSVTYRVGVMAIVAAVAGIMARELAKERQQAEDLVERLRELDVMKDDFIAITSHELRSPLTSIRGFVGTLRRQSDATPEQRDEYLGVIDRQTERLSRLIEDLFIASKIERGTLSIVKESVDVEEILKEVLTELGADAGRVRVGADALPLVRSDGQRLGQIARNLMENGLKFSPAGAPVFVEIRLQAEWLVLTFEDHGDGIAPEDVQRIFDRFYQVGGSKSRRARGAGLGLYITKWIVEALGGSTDVASERGRGSVFTVRLPFQPAEPEESARRHQIA